MNILSIDYETRSRVALKNVGAYRYASDSSTEIICCAFKLNDQPTKITINSDVIEGSNRSGLILSLCNFKNIPIVPIEEFIELLGRVDEVHAFNANFERCITTYILHQRFGFPDVPLSKWRCTQARVAANGGPLSLAGAAIALGLPVQKDSTGASLIAKLCKPNKKGEWTQSTTDSIDMYSYCMRDVEVEHMIRANTNPPIPSEIKLWQIDQQMNDAGIYVDKKLAENLLKLVEKEQPRIAQKVLSITNGEIDSYTKVAAIRFAS